jgi:AhpC/TSA family
MGPLEYYRFALFVHLLGALGLFVAFALEWLAVAGLRRASSRADAATWLGVMAPARRLGPLAMALILVPGLALALGRWAFAGWPAAALVGMAGIVLVGLLLTGPALRAIDLALRDPASALSPRALERLRTPRTVQALWIRTALGLGVVALMVYKPDLVSSLVVLAASALLGLGVSASLHRARQRPGRQVGADAVVAPRQLRTIRGETIRVPDPERLVHLQFRRFAGCPVCNLHLRSVVRRHADVLAAGIREVVVFHSSAEELRTHAAELPFAVIADPDKRLYVEFGVESSPRALLDPRAWPAIVRGVARSLVAIIRNQGAAPAVNPHGGRLGLPADFLIAGDGRVLACKYGAHAYDQWSVDELLGLARPERQRPASLAPRSQTA